MVRKLHNEQKSSKKTCIQIESEFDKQAKYRHQTRNIFHHFVVNPNSEDSQLVKYNTLILLFNNIKCSNVRVKRKTTDGTQKSLQHFCVCVAIVYNKKLVLSDKQITTSPSLHTHQRGRFNSYIKLYKIISKKTKCTSWYGVVRKRTV